MSAGLPKLEKKYFSTKLPDLGETVEYSLLTMGQQKSLMLLSLEKGSDEKQSRAMINIINDNVKDIEVKDQTKLDFLYLSYSIRASSDGNNIPFEFNNVKFEHKETKVLHTYKDLINSESFLGADTDEQKIKVVQEILKDYNKITHTNEFIINIQNDMEVTKGITKKVLKFDDVDLHIHLKAPSMEQLQYIDESEEIKTNERDLYYRMICIDYVVQGEETYNQFTFTDLCEFFENYVDDSIFKKINEFYDQLPKMVTNKEFNCSKWTDDVLLPKGKDVIDFL